MIHRDEGDRLARDRAIGVTTVRKVNDFIQNSEGYRTYSMNG